MCDTVKTRVKQMNQCFLGVKARLRRLLGTRISNTLRNALVTLNFALGLVPRVDRPQCISALMRVKNEEWWIESSILSIKDLVDEYVVVDASTDETPKIIDMVSKEHGLKLYHIIDYDDDIARASQKGLEKTLADGSCAGMEISL